MTKLDFLKNARKANLKPETLQDSWVTRNRPPYCSFGYTENRLITNCRLAWKSYWSYYWTCTQEHSSKPERRSCRAALQACHHDHSNWHPTPHQQTNLTYGTWPNPELEASWKQGQRGVATRFSSSTRVSQSSHSLPLKAMYCDSFHSNAHTQQTTKGDRKSVV